MNKIIAYKGLSDAELVGYLRDGEERAFTEVYGRYFYLMFVFAYKRLKDEDRAKDFVQDLFTNLWIKREEIRETDNLAPYLYITLRNRILNFFLHQQVEAKYLTFLKAHISNENNLHADYRIRAEQLQQYIEKEIQALPTKMRTVFELSRKEDLSYQEIARGLEISENNVSKHINGALKVLRTKLSTIFTLI